MARKIQSFWLAADGDGPEPALGEASVVRTGIADQPAAVGRPCQQVGDEILTGQGFEFAGRVEIGEDQTPPAQPLSGRRSRIGVDLVVFRAFQRGDHTAVWRNLEIEELATREDLFLPGRDVKP